MKRRSTISFAAAAALVVGLVVAPFAVAPASGASTLTSGTLAGRIYFAAGSSFLSSANKTKLLGIFKTYPNASRIDLIGYSQNRGLDKSSRVLAKARATSIKRYLANQGIGDEIVVNVGWQPAASAKLTTARRVNVWVRSLYTVTYNFQNPAATNTSVTYLQASTGLTLPTPTRTGFAFLGWYTAATGGSKVVSPFAPTASIVLYARWGAGYKVSFNANTATGTVPTAIDWDPTTAGVTLPTTATLTKTGFTFDGWSLTAGGAKLTSPYAPTADVTLYARWIVTITYNANGSTSGTAPVAATWAYGSTALTLPGAGTLAKTGYVFGGWSTTSTGTAVADPYTPTASITLYAVWGNTPVISTDTTITRNQAAPEIVVFGNAFDTTLTAADLVINYGTTGLAPCTVYSAATTVSSFTLRCSNTAQPGTITIKALTTAFSPVAVADSNLVSITVLANSISSPTLTIPNGTVDPVIDINSSASFKPSITIADLDTNWTTSSTTLNCSALGGATVTLESPTHVSLKCIGTARTGILTVSAKSTAFVSGAASNTLEFSVPAPVIASTSTISNHQSSPVALVFTGSLFDTAMTTSNLVISEGTTGLVCGTLSGKTSTGFTLNCTGTPKTGTVTVQAKPSAFAPDDTAYSNVKSFVVAAPAITVSPTAMDNGAAPPTLTVTGVGFRSGIGITDVAVTAGGTGISTCTLTNASSTSFDLNCSGTSTGGTLSIVVKKSGYDPEDTVDSTAATVFVPAISSSTTVARGATSVKVLINGAHFNSGIALSDLTITVGTTTLSASSIRFVSASQIEVTFTGTAAAGLLTFKANSTAYATGYEAASNVITITVP